MSLFQYTFGTALVAAFVGSVAYTAWLLRARFLPGWSGPPARLVETVAGLGVVVAVAELLGLFGLIHPWTLVPVAAGLALLGRFVLRRIPAVDRVDPEVSSVPPSPGVPGGIWPWLAAITVAFLLVAQWGSFVAQNLDHGITNFDSVWYHLPYAAEIARTGSVTWFTHTETVFTNWFYPQNSELIHGLLISLTGREFLSVFVNMAWLGLALLAGWCAGRPYGRPHLTMIAAAVVLSAHTLVVREPGTAKNDVVTVALVLAGIAILLNRSSAAKDGFGRVSPGWAVAAGGLAIGLAAGTKVTALAAAAMMTLAVGYAATAGRRARTIAVWLGALLVGGGWWYLRNLFASGNPLPQIDRLGPFALPGPDRLQAGRPDYTVAHYLTDTTIWREYFVPGLEQGFGRLWPVLVVIAVLGVTALVFRGPGRLTRAHGAVALIALLAYLVTPLGAAGPAGHPTAFSINLRFLAPALALALVLVPLLPWFDPGRRLRTAFGLLLGLLFLISWAEHPLGSTPGTVFGLALALLFVALPALAWQLRDRWPRAGVAGSIGPVGAAVGAATVLLVLVGWPLSQRYFEYRYAEFEPDSGLTEAYDWANGTRGKRIGLAGTTAGFRAFGFYGPDLTNRVIYIGAPGPAGAFNAIGSCRRFVRVVNESRLDYLVTSPYLNFLDPARPVRSPETSWVREEPALVPVVVNGPVRIWGVRGRLDPERCPSRGGGDFIPGRVEPTSR
ncbi:MAG: hypothetical protein M9938_05730 [Solirubrobacterales bacterium]|nr:hypothetical protein [Solirubrobacterales bacterium]